jgi:ABC-type lipoprotein export system ATPase subunit
VTDAPAPLVRIRDLRYSYPGGPEILRIPALDVTGRGLIALTGPSGAGKSTLVELLAGTLQEGYYGSVEVLGHEWRNLRRDADRQRHLRLIGFIPQDFGLLPHRTPREMLEQDLTDADVPAAEHTERIERALSEVDLTDLSDQRIASLSGGQGQRVAVARMLARDVELVIADEPTANLDPGLRGVVMGLLRKLSEHVPVLVVTHDAAVAESCDRTIILQAAAAHAVEPIVPTSGRERAHRRRIAVLGLVILLLAASASGITLAVSRKTSAERPHGSPANSVPVRPSVTVRLAAISAGEATAPTYSASLSYPELSSGNLDEGPINTVLIGTVNRVLGAFQAMLNAYPPVTETGAYQMPPSSLTGSFSTNFLNPDFASFTLSYYQYETGVVHGTDTIETFNFNERTGKQYQLPDLFRPGTDWLGALSSESRALLPAIIGNNDGLSVWESGSAPKASNFSAWALTPWGLSIEFQDYQVGPYAAGTPTIVIPYRSLQPLLSATSPILMIENAPPARTILLPATSPPAVNECEAPVSYTSAGDIRLTCPDGELNVNAWDDISGEDVKVLLLGPTVTSQEVNSTMCADLHQFKDYSAQNADQMELQAERLAELYYGWHLSSDPASQFPYYCPTKT